jgi:DinB family protein
MTHLPIDPLQTSRLLGAALVTLRVELTALPEGVRAWHPAPGAWCAKEVLGHLIEAERRGFAGRIRTILAVEEPVLEAWDQVEVARARGDCGRDVEELLAEFVPLREAGISLAAGLSAGDLLRGGQHPRVGRLRVADLVQEWVFHDRNHLRQLMANVQEFVWPAMGNAQRFSAERMREDDP